MCFSSQIVIIKNLTNMLDEKHVKYVEGNVILSEVFHLYRTSIAMCLNHSVPFNS